MDDLFVERGAGTEKPQWFLPPGTRSRPDRAICSCDLRAPRRRKVSSRCAASPIEDGQSFRLNSTALSGGLDYLIIAAEDDARRAQNPKSVTWCPPLAVFATKISAAEDNVGEGPVITVECDASPGRSTGNIGRDPRPGDRSREIRRRHHQRQRGTDQQAALALAPHQTGPRRQHPGEVEARPRAWLPPRRRRQVVHPDLSSAQVAGQLASQRRAAAVQDRHAHRCRGRPRRRAGEIDRGSGGRRQRY